MKWKRQVRHRSGTGPANRARNLSGPEVPDPYCIYTGGPAPRGPAPKSGNSGPADLQTLFPDPPPRLKTISGAELAKRARRQR